MWFHPAGLNDTQQGGLYSRQTLDFSSMPAVILVQDGGRLLFDNVVLANIAPTYAYDYSLQAPWRNAGVGYPLWPTIMLESNATVSQDAAGAQPACPCRCLIMYNLPAHPNPTMFVSLAMQLHAYGLCSRAANGCISIHLYRSLSKQSREEQGRVVC